MRRTLKKYFIPHAENNYHPHILHAKRAFFYSAIFLAVKIIVVAFVLFLPAEVFVMPDVLAEEQKQIIALTNKIRTENKVRTLAVAQKLNSSSQAKADDMADNGYFAHYNNNKGVGDWLRDVKYNYEVAGENLAVGFSSAAEVVEAWKNSPTHYVNLVDSDFTEFGVGIAGGVYNGEPTVFIAQHLADPVDYAADNLIKPTIEHKKAAAKKTEKAEEKKAVENNASSTVLAAKTDNQDKTKETPEPKTPEPVVKLGAPSPIDKYIHAKSVLSPITNIFKVSQGIYLGAICFFAIALLLNIFIEIKKQHSHVIVQSCALIVLLFCFWKF